MSIFGVSKPKSAAITASTGASLVITASATKPLRIHQGNAIGAGTSSAAIDLVFQVCEGTPTGGISITPVNRRPGGSAASFTAVYDATGGLTYTANTAHPRMQVNENGGYCPLTPIPGLHLSVPVGTSIALRSLSGTGLFVANLDVEEVDD